MMGSNAVFFAICRDCDRVYSATTSADDRLQLGGGKLRCYCGSAEFELVGDGAPSPGELVAEREDEYTASNRG